MTDLLIPLYPWIKAGHIASVLAWMAGLFYLPRLYVYHAERVSGGETAALFQTMEEKLLRLIMNPAMIATWVFGLLLVAIPGVVDWSMIWPWAKTAAVLGMTWFHMWCAARRKVFAAGTNDKPGRHYRLMNEVPTLLMLVIVVSVVVKPI